VIFSIQNKRKDVVRFCPNWNKIKENKDTEISRSLSNIYT